MVSSWNPNFPLNVRSYSIQCINLIVNRKSLNSFRSSRTQWPRARDISLFLTMATDLMPIRSECIHRSSGVGVWEFSIFGSRWCANWVNVLSAYSPLNSENLTRIAKQTFQCCQLQTSKAITFRNYIKRFIGSCKAVSNEMQSIGFSIATSKSVPPDVPVFAFLREWKNKRRLRMVNVWRRNSN